MSGRKRETKLNSKSKMRTLSPFPWHSMPSQRGERRNWSNLSSVLQSARASQQAESQTQSILSRERKLCLHFPQVVPDSHSGAGPPSLSLPSQKAPRIITTPNSAAVASSKHTQEQETLCKFCCRKPRGAVWASFPTVLTAACPYLHHCLFLWH